jgi:hypothetical protein
MDQNNIHPLIVGLIEMLPPPDTVWPINEQEKWLEAAKSIIDLLYHETSYDNQTSSPSDMPQGPGGVIRLGK